MKEGLHKITPDGISLKADLVIGLSNNSSLAEMFERIRLFKGNGGQQTEAVRILESVRNEITSEQSEDIVLELMDFVTGYCSPSARIWD